MLGRSTFNLAPSKFTLSQLAAHHFDVESLINTATSSKEQNNVQIKELLPKSQRNVHFSLFCFILK
jgi:hypothetical protein